MVNEEPNYDSKKVSTIHSSLVTNSNAIKKFILIQSLKGSSGVK